MNISNKIYEKEDKIEKLLVSILETIADATESVEVESADCGVLHFPMLKYAFKVAETTDSYSIAYNAANEVAVEAFINKSIKFNDIPVIVKKVLDCDWSKVPESFEEVFDMDARARAISKDFL